MRNFFFCLLFFIFSCISCNKVFGEGDNSEISSGSSIFDLLNNDIKSMKTVEPDVSKGSELEIIPPLYSAKDVKMEVAKIKIINSNTGIADLLELRKGEVINFNGFALNLISCWAQDKTVLNRESKALIVIKNAESQEIVFDGWILSKHKGFSQPKCGKHFITLFQCFNNDKH